MSTASRGSQGGSGISFQTLAIASASSLAAALVVHRVWGGGAILGAAVTPVIVGIVGEALRRPVDKLAAPRDGGRRLPADRARDVPPSSRERGDDPFGLWEQKRSSRGRTWLVLGIVTGVIGFAIAAFFLTGSELVFGGSVSGPRKTTIFGGANSTTATTTVQTVTRTTTTPTVTQTVPVPAPQATGPTTTVPPAATQAPQQQAAPVTPQTTPTQPPATTPAP